MSERILVIKLGALGDLILCAQAFASIRQKHPQAKIALLTGPAFVPFACEMPWFDEVLTDTRPRFGQMGVWRDLIGKVKTFNPTQVYDLQGKFRQSILYYSLGGPLWGPLWSGAAKGCSHPRPWPPQAGMHYTDFVAAQLQSAGVPLVENVDTAWLAESLEPLCVPERFALLIPGCAPSRPYKRWPAEAYAALAKKLAAQGIASMAIGTKHDADSIAAIRALAPDVINLAGQTSLKQLGTLARRAVAVIGNDTGPTHLAAAVGAKTVALMSDRVDANWSSPKGPRTVWLQGRPLADLSVEDVAAKLDLSP